MVKEPFPRNDTVARQNIYAVQTAEYKQRVTFSRMGCADSGSLLHRACVPGSLRGNSCPRRLASESGRQSADTRCQRAIMSTKLSVFDMSMVQTMADFWQLLFSLDIDKPRIRGEHVICSVRLFYRLYSARSIAVLVLFFYCCVHLS